MTTHYDLKVRTMSIDELAEVPAWSSRGSRAVRCARGCKSHDRTRKTQYRRLEWITKCAWIVYGWIHAIVAPHGRLRREK